MSTLEKDETIVDREKGHKHDDGWQELADFFVSFGLAMAQDQTPHLQTRIYYSQADRSAQWEGLASSRMVNWMLHELGPSLRAEGWDLDEGSAPDVIDSEPPLLEMSGLWVTETHAPIGKLRAEVCVSLIDESVAESADARIPFLVDFYLDNVETQNGELVACHPGYLAPGKVDCGIEQDWAIPAAGRYQVRVVARLLPPWRGSAQLLGPVVVVEL